MDAAALKSIHVAAVALSGAGFFARGIAALAGARWVRGRAARTLPHVVDTVLLASAIALALRLGLSPLAAPWLAAKIGGLAAYVGLGMLAMRPGRPFALRAAAWAAALATFGWIVSVAILKHPAGFLGAG